MIVTYCLGFSGFGALLLLVHLKALVFPALLICPLLLLLQILFIPLASHDVNHLVVEVVLLVVAILSLCNFKITTAEAVDDEVGVAVVAFSEVEIDAEFCSGTAVQVALVGIIEVEVGLVVVLVHVEGGAVAGVLSRGENGAQDEQLAVLGVLDHVLSHEGFELQVAFLARECCYLLQGVGPVVLDEEVLEGQDGCTIFDLAFLHDGRGLVPVL